MIYCAKIVFATTSLRPITTPLPNLVNNVWWKPKKCRHTLLQERPLHAFAHDTKNYHQSAGVVHPCAHLVVGCVKIVFATTSLRPITTPLPNRVNNVCWKPKKCRHTLFQERPLHAFVHDTKKYHQSAGVVHHSAPLVICCVKIVFATPSLRPLTTPLPNLVVNVVWKPKKCRLTLLQGRPLHAFTQDTQEYHHSAGVVHQSAPLVIGCVKIFFATTSLRPITTPLPNVVNNVSWKPQ